MTSLQLSQIVLVAAAIGLLGGPPLMAQPIPSDGAGSSGTGGSCAGAPPGTPGWLDDETPGRDVTGTTVPPTGSASRDARRPAGAETGIAPGSESGIQPIGPYEGNRAGGPYQGEVPRNQYPSTR